MPASISDRVSKRRAALRAAGLRPVQLWVPDSRRPGFAVECARQSVLMAEADRADVDLMADLDAAAEDAAAWT